MERCAVNALAHIIILNEFSLKRILKTYLQYNEYSRTHLSLEKDAPISKTVQLPELGVIFVGVVAAAWLTPT